MGVWRHQTSVVVIVHTDMTAPHLRDDAVGDGEHGGDAAEGDVCLDGAVDPLHPVEVEGSHLPLRVLYVHVCA